MKTSTSFSPMTDRYAFDFKTCTPANGWAQLDTKQDASYYGNWINPITRKLVSYCEGDVTLKECETDAEFVAELKVWIDWQKERGYFIGIDGMCRPEIIEAFTRLGFAADLH